jgi:hypothetical protein
MKKLYKYIKVAVGALFLSALVVSCLPDQESMGNAGQTLVKISPAGFSLLALDAKSVAQSGPLFEVRRDVNSQAALASGTTVVLEYDVSGDILTKYNDVNGTNYIPLPSSLGTTDPAILDGKVVLDFGSGEFSKPIILNVPNASAFDFTQQYAFAFKLTTVTGTGVKSAAVNDTIVAQVLVKNKYDGKYVITANSPMVDILNSGLTGWYPFTYELETSGENSVTCLLTDPAYYNYYHPITSAGSYSVYGAFGLELFFDPSGNGKIIAVTNPWGNPPANTRMPVLDPSGDNSFDLATKNISLKYWMKQPSLVPDPPNIRTSFDETWTYKGSR